MCAFGHVHGPQVSFSASVPARFIRTLGDCRARSSDRGEVRRVADIHKGFRECVPPNTQLERSGPGSKKLCSMGFDRRGEIERSDRVDAWEVDDAPHAKRRRNRFASVGR